MQNPKKLDLVLPFTFLAVFIVAVVVLFEILASISDHRKEKVYNQYATETKKYMEQNKEPLLLLFTAGFPDANNCNSTQTICGSNANPGKLLSSNLKDFSSTMFLKAGKDKPIYMRLSGETGILYPYPEEREQRLNRLLNGEVDKIEWDDYIYDLPNKEVIVPFKDKSGKTIGAIARGVIE